MLRKTFLSLCCVFSTQILLLSSTKPCDAATALDFDLAPYLIDGKLVMGGRTHSGLTVAPGVTVFGYSPSDNTTDPYNPANPGFNQVAGTGNLPGGSLLYCRVTSSLLYWDGVGETDFGPSDNSTRIDLWLRASHVSIDSDSGVQSQLLIQSVSPYGSVHMHGVSALYADSIHSNYSEDSNYLMPADGIYAYSMVVSMYSGENTYTSDTLWIVLNYGLPDSVLVSAVNAIDATFVPEPSTGLLLIGACATLARRRSL